MENQDNPPPYLRILQISKKSQQVYQHKQKFLNSKKK